MTRSILPFVVCAGCAVETPPARGADVQLASVANNRVYFGGNEVRAGRLSSASGELPGRGEAVVLQVDLDLAAAFLCGGLDFDLPLGTGFQACRGIDPELFVRFRADDAFMPVVDSVPTGGRVPQLAPYGTPIVHYADLQHGYTWFEAAIAVPHDATRIEVYQRTGRVIARCRHTHTSEQRECFHLEQLADGYISNYGANFLIEVQ